MFIIHCITQHLETMKKLLFAPFSISIESIFTLVAASRVLSAGNIRTLAARKENEGVFHLSRRFVLKMILPSKTSSVSAEQAFFFMALSSRSNCNYLANSRGLPQLISPIETYPLFNSPAINGQVRL